MKALQRTLGLTALLLTGGCRKAPEPRALPPPRSALQPILRFQPPADGVVTDGELDRYVRARRAARGRADDEAVRAVGIDPEEFAWVRARVVEAVAALEERRIRAAADGTYSRTIASLKETRKAVKDRETLASIDEQLAGLERERVAVRRPTELSPAVAANARRVASRRSDLDAFSK